MSSFRITLCTWCFYIAGGPQVLRITAETYSLTSPRPLLNELLHASQFWQVQNLPASMEQSENVQQQAAVKKVQYFSIPADSKLQVHRFSKRDAYKMHIKEAELDYDDMELAEINVFRPLFQYRLAYAKQVRNAQRRQFG